jgi:hypothetical protein
MMSASKISAPAPSTRHNSMASTPRRRQQRDTTPTSTPPPARARPSTLTSGASTSTRSREQVLRRNAKSVDENIDRELVRILLSAKRFLRFTDACIGQEHLFGDIGSSLRKKVWNRRAKLVALQQDDPQAFHTLTQELLLTRTGDSPPPESPESSPSAFEDESLQTRSSTATSSSRTPEPVTPTAMSYNKDGNDGKVVLH